MPDPYDLERFLRAQDSGGAYDRALAELRAGRKTSHWMWFVFPQVAGLGLSAMSRRYAISSLAEAAAYLEHPVLGGRLLACAQAVSESEAASAAQIFGSVDAQKLQSSLTLFSRVPGADPVFARGLDRYFDGAADQQTLARV
jgi:uncharacterized protein (DUF1810 family)